MGATGYIIKGSNGGRGGEARKEVVVSAADGTIDVDKVETFDKVDFRIKTTYDGYETINVGSLASGGYFKAAHIKFNEENRRYRLVCILNGGSYTPVAKDFAIYYIKFGWRTGGVNADHWYIEEYSRQGNGAYVSLEQIALNEYNVLIHTPTGYAYANIGILKEDKEPDVTIDHFNNNTTRYTPTGTIIETETPAWKNGALVDTNLEDLEIRNGLLQLADRSSIDGLGYVILRPDKTFAEQVTLSNCIYEIRYNFDLNGASVTIPSNCVLRFDGGKLSNGRIECQSTYLIGDIHFNSITFSATSTIKNEEYRLSWFDVDSNNYSALLDNLITVPDVKRLYFDVLIVKLSHPCVFTSKIDMYGLHSDSEKTTISPALDWSSTGYDRNTLFYFNTSSTTNIRITDLKFCGGFNVSSDFTGTDYVVGYGMYFRSTLIGSITNCSFEKFYITSMKISGTENCYINYVYIRYCGSAILISPTIMDELNPLVYSNETELGHSQSSAILHLSHIYSIFTNYGIVGGALGTSVSIFNSAISHTSCYAIYVSFISYILDIHDNYFEGCGKGTFWIDENGFQGSNSSSDTDNLPLCNHLLNSHPGEMGNVVDSGWGLYVDNVLLRPIIASAINANTGTFVFRNNMLSIYNVRSKNSLVTTVNKSGVDAILASTSGPIYSDNNHYNVSVQDYPLYFYIFCGNSASVTNSSKLIATIKNTPLIYKDKYPYKFNYSLYSKGASIKTDYTTIPKYWDEEFLAVRKSVSSSLTISSDLFELSSFCDIYSCDDSEVFYKFPTEQDTAPAFSIPLKYCNCGLISFLFKNISSINQVKVISYFRYKVGNTYTDFSKGAYSNRLKTITAGNSASHEYFISKDDIPEGCTEIILILKILEGDNYDVVFSAPKILELTENNIIRSLDYTYLGFRKAGSSLLRPSKPTEGFRYFDTDLGKPIYWTGSKWVDATGADLQ